MRDYILASPLAFQYVTSFSVVDEDAFVTHSVLTCTLDFSKTGSTSRKLRAPASLSHLAQQSFIQKYNMVCLEHAECHCTGPLWKDHVHHITSVMDAAFDSVTDRVSQLCAQTKTDEAWELWVSVFETSILNACSNVDRQHRFKGHAYIQLCSQADQSLPKCSPMHGLHLDTANSFAGHLRKQYNRVQKLIEYIKLATPERQPSWQTLCKIDNTLRVLKHSCSDFLAKVPNTDFGADSSAYVEIAHDIAAKLPDCIDAHYCRFLPVLQRVSAALHTLMEKSNHTLSRVGLTRTTSVHHKAALCKGSMPRSSKSVRSLCAVYGLRLRLDKRTSLVSRLPSMRAYVRLGHPYVAAKLTKVAR